MAETIDRVMVITAHPDDSEFGAGGTIARMVQDGREVTYVIATNGNKGSSDRTMTPERLAAEITRLASAPEKLVAMAQAARQQGVLDAAERLADLVQKIMRT